MCCWSLFSLLAWQECCTWCHLSVSDRFKHWVLYGHISTTFSSFFASFVPCSSWISRLYSSVLLVSVWSGVAAVSHVIGCSLCLLSLSENEGYVVTLITALQNLWVVDCYMIICMSAGEYRTYRLLHAGLFLPTSSFNFTEQSTYCWSTRQALF